MIVAFLAGKGVVVSNIPELYGFIWIESIKKYAKELKRSLPDLGYLERLEVAARQFAGKRNYNECRKLHEKHLLSYRYVEEKNSKIQTILFLRRSVVHYQPAVISLLRA